MNRTELQDLISRTDRSDWTLIDSGPLFHPTFDVLFDGASGDGRIVDVDTHLSRLVCDLDLDVAIEWGMRVHRGESEHHPWAEDASFPDPKVTTYYADIFYRGALVDRHYVCSVDGGRAILPAPHARTPEGVEPSEATSWIWSASPYRTAIARLISGDRHDFDDYMNRAGIVLEPTGAREF